MEICKYKNTTLIQSVLPISSQKSVMVRTVYLKFDLLVLSLLQATMRLWKQIYKIIYGNSIQTCINATSECINYFFLLHFHSLKCWFFIAYSFILHDLSYCIIFRTVHSFCIAQSFVHNLRTKISLPYKMILFVDRQHPINMAKQI